MKNFLSVLCILISFTTFSQSGRFKNVELNGKKIEDISMDTSFANAAHNKLATQKATKDYVDNRMGLFDAYVHQALDGYKLAGAFSGTSYRLKVFKPGVNTTLDSTANDITLNSGRFGVEDNSSTVNRSMLLNSHYFDMIAGGNLTGTYSRLFQATGSVYGYAQNGSGLSSQFFIQPDFATINSANGSSTLQLQVTPTAATLKRDNGTSRNLALSVNGVFADASNNITISAGSTSRFGIEDNTSSVPRIINMNGNRIALSDGTTERIILNTNDPSITTKLSNTGAYSQMGSGYMAIANSGGFTATIVANALAANYIYQLPNHGGTIATLDDIGGSTPTLQTVATAGNVFAGDLNISHLQLKRASNGFTATLSPDNLFSNLTLMIPRAADGSYITTSVNGTYASNTGDITVYPVYLSKIGLQLYNITAGYTADGCVLFYKTGFSTVTNGNEDSNNFNYLASEHVYLASSGAHLGIEGRPYPATFETIPMSWRGINGNNYRFDLSGSGWPPDDWTVWLIDAVAGTTTPISRYSATQTYTFTATTGTENTRFSLLVYKNQTGVPNIGLPPQYADNAAAIAGGLRPGDQYRIGGAVQVVY